MRAKSRTKTYGSKRTSDKVGVKVGEVDEEINTSKKKPNISHWSSKKDDFRAFQE